MPRRRPETLDPEVPFRPIRLNPEGPFRPFRPRSGSGPNPAAQGALGLSGIVRIGPPESPPAAESERTLCMPNRTAVW